MTDHTDPGQMRQAKEWAKRIIAGNLFANDDEISTARYITALPKTIVDADKVQEQVELLQNEAAGMASEGLSHRYLAIANRLQTILTPKPKTLDDLIKEGHDPAQHQWMQAEHRDERCIIIRINGQAFQPTVSLLTATGATIWASTDEVIPLPDLPRLLWPTSEPEPAEGSSTPEVAPKVLLTEEDYREAPNRTIVAEVGGVPFYASAWAWQTLGGGMYSHCDLAGFPRHVIRWGMGEQA